MRNLIVSSIAILVVLSAGVFLISDAEGEVIEETTYYCYGDDPIIVPTMGTSTKETWTVTLEDGTPVPWDPNDDRGDGSITVHIADCNSTVKVVQTVNGDSAVVNLIPLHLKANDADGDGNHQITYYDGAKIFETVYITNNTLPSEGDNHVGVPADPSKNGYTFEGWYTDPHFSEDSEFDPTQPVFGDIDVYAKWLGTGSDSTSSSVTIDRTRVVTFDVCTGLEYTITGNTGTTISFEISVVGGYELKDGTLSVTATSGSVTGSGMNYTLSGINTNITVTIDGGVSAIMDPGGIDEPEEPKEPADDGGFPLWIVVVIVVIIVAIVAVIWYMRGRI